MNTALIFIKPFKKLKFYLKHFINQHNTTLNGIKTHILNHRILNIWILPSI